MNLDGKNAIVTGGASGIGRAVALRLAGAGARVAVFDLDFPGADTVARLACDAGGRAVAVPVDISDSAAVNAAVAKARDAFGPVHVLVHCAGIGGWSLVPDLTDAQWHRMRAVNLDGTFFLARAVLPDMIDAHWGRIVNISSGAGQNGGGAGLAHYAATKAGVIGLTKAMALEVATQGITVNAVSPGVVDTPINQNVPADQMEAIVQRIPMRRLGTPEDIAGACAYLVSEEAAYMTGQVLCPNGGFSM